MSTKESAIVRDSSLVPSTGLSTAPLSPEQFRTAFRNHAAGIAVITADAGEGPVAMTATSVFSISATPPLLVFSVSELSSATPTIVRASSVVVHLLVADQLDLAKLCATSGADRFADTTSWSRLETGEPYFVSAPIWIRGEIVDKLEAGSSTLVVVRATQTRYPESAATRAGRPLVYHNRTWHSLGEHSVLD